MWWETPWLVLSFTTYLADTATDALTALLLLQAGHTLAGCLTALLLLLPGVVACVLELKRAWREGGNPLKGLVLLLLCPLWALLTHVYALHSTQWRSRALLLKTVEGLVCAGPQLVLQMALLFRGTLTSPVSSLIQETGLTPMENDQTTELQLFGRDFGVAEQEHLAYIQLASVLISFFSVLTSVLHFNELEAGAGPNLARFCLGLPFFLLTIVFRSVTLALLICFLSWWSAILLFLLFFLTLLTSLCAGDTFKRAATYGLWSVLAPVGHARDPLTNFGYTKLPATSQSLQEREEKKRSSFFVLCHIISSLLLLGPALVLVTVLVQRAAHLSEAAAINTSMVWQVDLVINTKAVFPVHLLSSLFLPLLGLALALSLLLARPYIHIRNCSMGETKSYAISG